MSLAAGETSGTITVRVNGDLLTEGPKSFFVRLTNPVSATIAMGGVVSIVDNEP